MGGGDLALHALAYAQPSQEVMNYISNNVNNVLATASGYANNFVNAVRDSYESFTNSAIIQKAKTILQTGAVPINYDIIYTVNIDNYYTVTPKMQEYILAEPSVANLYRKNMCYGFEDTCVYPETDTYGEDTYLYQRAMDGVLQHGNDGRGYIRYYSNADEVELDTMDKLSVLDTWDTVRLAIAQGLDPTDPDLPKI